MVDIFQQLTADYKARKDAACAEFDRLQIEASKAEAASERYVRLAITKHELSEKLSHKAYHARWAVHWHQLLVPILQEVTKRTGIEWTDLDDLPTFGIANETPVFASNNSLFLKFYPSDADADNPILVWTGETTNRYPIGSIGELNGGNNVIAPLTSIEQLIEIINKQLTANASTTQNT